MIRVECITRKTGHGRMDTRTSSQAESVEEKRRDQDRRHEPRVPHRGVHIMAFGMGEELEFEPAELMDCSLHGVAILLNREIQAGHHFFVKLKIAGRVTLVNYIVRNCREVGRGLFRIGGEFCEFVGASEEPPMEKLMAALMGE
jgi:hypothetical protein